MNLTEYRKVNKKANAEIEKQMAAARQAGIKAEATRQDGIYHFFGTKLSPQTKMALDNNLSPAQFVLSQGDMLPRAKNNSDQFTVPKAPSASEEVQVVQNEKAIRVWDRIYSGGYQS